MDQVEFLDNGFLDSKDIIRFGNIVTKSITGNDLPDELPILQFDVTRNDQLVMCTDRFWRNINLKLIMHQSKDTMHNSFIEMGKRIDELFNPLDFYTEVTRFNPSH